VSPENDDIDLDIDFEDDEDDAENQTEILRVGQLDLSEPEPQVETSVPPDEDLEVFGNYRLLGRVGGKENVEVWVVGDETAGQTCVLKRVLNPSDSRTEVAVLSDEIRVTEPLHHPNIVESISSGIVDGIPYITMELVDGMSLTDLNGIMGRSARPLGAVLDLGIQISEAMAYLHGAIDYGGRPLDLIHSNLRPHNVFVTREGYAKLGEVGVSFPVASAELEKKISLPYLAPEQFGRHPVDGRADIYTLGLILIELLSGKVVAPFGSLAMHDSKVWQTNLDLPLPLEVSDYLTTMIERSKRIRPASAEQVTRDLRRLFQRHGAGQSLGTYLAEHVFSNVPSMESSEQDLEALSRRRGQSITDGGAAVMELPEDALEDLSYPSTVSLIIDDFDWDAIADPEQDQDALKVLNPVAVEPADSPSPARPRSHAEIDDRPRTLRLGPEGRRIIAEDPAFRRALGIKTAKAVNDSREWDYYYVAGDEMGPRIIQKSLTSARPYQDQVVIFLRESELLMSFDLEEDGHELEHGSVWAGDDSGYGEMVRPAQDPNYLRYHERALVHSAPRRGTSVRGRVLRFLGK